MADQSNKIIRNDDAKDSTFGLEFGLSPSEPTDVHRVDILSPSTFTSLTIRPYSDTTATPVELVITWNLDGNSIPEGTTLRAPKGFYFNAMTLLIGEVLGYKAF